MKKLETIFVRGICECPFCGEKVGIDDNYCQWCGKKLKKTPAEQEDVSQVEDNSLLSPREC